ncbi:hypothetical protein PILCRDRAFT_476357 [Piloderma croceum F 1598]|uniref:Uncharacterized protein n=1 Tax=Piloderma croceum (strain F 1598) TaxID=765440 RepID=A0A0C3FTX7_PILCF|nr:hypothetical protein PILCRDRAFT_476357 [Piloderma croceum F 1598]
MTERFRIIWRTRGMIRCHAFSSCERQQQSGGEKENEPKSPLSSCRMCGNFGSRISAHSRTGVFFFHLARLPHPGWYISFPHSFWWHRYLPV